MCVHNGQGIVPDLRDVDAADDSDEKALAEMIRNHFPGIEDKPSIKDTCIYTVSFSYIKLEMQEQRMRVFRARERERGRERISIHFASLCNQTIRQSIAFAF